MASTPQPIVLVGGGGHALVVAEGAIAAGLTIAGFLDDDERAVLASGDPSAPHFGALFDLDRIGDRSWIICVGAIAARRRIIDAIGDRRGGIHAVHPAAFVAPTARLSAGVYVGPGAVVHTRATVGDHAIINSAGVIEHECTIGENTHIAPGVVLGGRVTVGQDTLVGLGARVLPNVNVGPGCIVGAGAVVTRDVPAGSTVAGHPARSR